MPGTYRCLAKKSVKSLPGTNAIPRKKKKRKKEEAIDHLLDSISGVFDFRTVFVAFQVQIQFIWIHSINYKPYVPDVYSLQV